MQWYLLMAGVGLVAVTAALLLRRGRRRPQTADEKAAAARNAIRSMRRSSPRSSNDVFTRGWGVPDRHSGAVAENATYGDAANFDSGGGGAAGSD
ncbi:hypothetical protein [Actinoplanes sp. NPDC048796]|uniref:hypothetical protein n=1 Tax=unclassified Actinoplanes TaxID=2626549 RepID=UPI0033D7C0BE